MKNKVIIPKKYWLILDIKNLSLDELVYLKINSPCVFRDDIPPLENWYLKKHNKFNRNELKIIRNDFPKLFKKIISKIKKNKK